MANMEPSAAAADEKHLNAAAVAKVLDSVERIARELEDEAPASEQLGKLTDRAVELLFANGVHNLYAPKELGGLGLYPGEALPVLKRIAAIDGSIGWVSTIFAAGGLLINYLAPEVSDAILASGENICFGAVSNGQGTAELGPDGWKISGNYRYGSGVKHANYVFMPAMKIVNGAPLPMPQGMGFFLVPASALELQQGWDVLGLKATGSVDFSVKDLLLPQSHETHVMALPSRGGRAASGGLTVLIPIMHLGFALGIVERLITEMKAVAAKKPPMPGAPSMGETDLFRAEFARKYAEAKSAEAWVMQVMADIDETLRQGQQMSTRQHTLLRAVNIHAHEVARDIANWAFKRAGGAALRDGTLQRTIRDALAGCQHFIASDTHYVNVGFDLIGAPEDHMWLGLFAFGPAPKVADATLAAA